MLPKEQRRIGPRGCVPLHWACPPLFDFSLKITRGKHDSINQLLTPIIRIIAFLGFASYAPLLSHLQPNLTIDRDDKGHSFISLRSSFPGG